MTETPNLKIPHIDGSQNQKYVTANEGLDFLDQAFNSVDTTALDDLVGDTYLAEEDFTRAFKFVLTDALTSPNLTGPFNIIVPELARFFMVENTTDFVATFRTGVSAGNTVAVGPGEKAFIHSDATDLTSLGVLNIADIGFYFTGSPVSGQTILIFTAPETFVLAQNLPTLRCYAETAPADGNWVVDVQKNGASIGSITLQSGSKTAISAVLPQTSFVPGDYLSLIAPNPADSAIENVMIYLPAVRA